MNLKERLIEYRNNNSRSWTSVIKDDQLKRDLMDHPHFTQLPLNQKAAAIILGFVPVCDCGMPVKFSGKIKEGINSTPFGGWSEFCCTTCSRSSQKLVERRKQTNIEKYGVDSWAKTNQAREISSQTWSDEKKDNYNKKAKQTSLLKYGVDHYSKTQEYIEKRNNTVLSQTDGKYTNYFQDIEKIKQINNEKYGVDYYTQTLEGRNRLSVNNAMKRADIALKSKLKRQSNHFSQDLFEILLKDDSIEFKKYIDDIASINQFNHRRQISNYLSISYSYLNNLMRRYDMNDDYLTLGTSKSYKEQEVVDFILSLNINLKRGDRKILNGKEIDILIESHKLGIEFDGIYYHSVFSGGKDKTYHVDKTNLAEENGYHLLHIFENEWNDPIKQTIWKSIIKSKLGLYDRRLFARKCKVKNISSTEARAFFDTNHLSGFVGASNHVGLFYENELVSAISYGKSRFDKTETELYRFASVMGTQVIGGLSKLLSQIKTDKLVSFADRRISGVDSVYNKFFSKRKTISPCWWGFKTGTDILNHRLVYTKQRVKLLLNNKYNDNLSCIDNMFNNGYDIIYDCGNYKFYN